MKTFRFALAQINTHLGDLSGNTKLIIDTIQKARDTLRAHVVIFPELTITGYPPDDLLQRPHLYHRTLQALDTICQHVTGIEVIIGYPAKTNAEHATTGKEAGAYNAAALIANRHIQHVYHKQQLPNYSVFHEKRYFQPGRASPITQLNRHALPIALFICEDLWCDAQREAAKRGKPKLAIVLNASPFMEQKHNLRLIQLKKAAQSLGCPVLYVNQVGAQDELVFDGGSMVVDAHGVLSHQARFFAPDLLSVTCHQSTPQSPLKVLHQDPLPSLPPSIDCLYQALVLGLQDYKRKNHFQRALVGLSGGIDSALTLAIAVSALGAKNVTAVLMPSRYTQPSSIQDARIQATLLGVSHTTISIEPAFQAFLDTFAKTNAPIQTGSLAEQNLQARCRAVILMALSNQKNALLLSTSNKSEIAVGYTTLYGDMCGGFCVLKDVFKTQVYALSAYCNRHKTVIYPPILKKPPSAELTHQQTDQDSLPDYETLDAIIKRSIEARQPPSEIIAAGFPATTVQHVLHLIQKSEHKRHQAPPGICLTPDAFGRARLIPMSSAYESQGKNE